MDDATRDQIQSLRRLTTKELKTLYGELFGEASSSSNQVHLYRRLAWRLQALAEGDLSERARERAAELALDADLRLRAPRKFWEQVTEAETREKTQNNLRDSRLPPPGTELTRQYQGQLIRVQVAPNGFEYQGKRYASLSAIASKVTGMRWNGFSFFGLNRESRPMSEEPRSVRCAIYTRKSTEEGLEQEFNTLRAQRESAEAYILSQRQAGWLAVATQYDDGGFSGASLERPGLKQLLADVERRKIDCVLVYKVDRLSRSLLDFTRLLQLFERSGVSFVSVTQEFNTTTSLGRLTLHILLSFAQFEREIIGERTRDKIGAARRKGKWIGGTPVLGYDIAPEGGRLLVNEPEAEHVRNIFQTAANAKSLEEALKRITAGGIATKPWHSNRGPQRSPKPFTRMRLRALLANVLYTGSVSYQGTVYPGEHARIVDQELWDKVNQQLLARSAHRVARSHRKPEALLAELLDCGQCGGSMRLTYTTKNGQRHRYYVCPAATRQAGSRCLQRPVSASDLESSLARHLQSWLGGQLSAPILHDALRRLSYDSATRRVLLERSDGTRSEYHLAEPHRGGWQSDGSSKTEGRVPRISRLLALAIKFERLRRECGVLNYRNLAEAGHISRARISQIMRLNELAPSIQEELLLLPRTLTGADLITESGLREIAMVVDWEGQKKKFRALMAAVQNS